MTKMSSLLFNSCMMYFLLPSILVLLVDHVTYGDFSFGTIYCEIITRDPATDETLVDASGGGTWDCPLNPGFYNVSEDDVREVRGQHVEVDKNGARQWMSDQSIEQDGAPESQYQPVMYGSDIFPNGDGLFMVEIARLNTSPENAVYVQNAVERYSTLFYSAGQTVYELVAANCEHIFVMQSYYIGYPGNYGLAQSMDDLPLLALNDEFFLPDGWVYRSRVLKEDLYIHGEGDGTTMVIRDGVRTSYSKMDEPFDRSLCVSELSLALYDADTDKPLEILGNKIDVCRMYAGVSLTLVAIPADKKWISYILSKQKRTGLGFGSGGQRLKDDDDGLVTVTKSVQFVEPFALGGDIDGDLLPVDALSDPGSYTIELTSAPGGQQFFDFEVVGC